MNTELDRLAEACKKIRVEAGLRREEEEKICKKADRLLKEYLRLRHGPSYMPERTLTEQKAKLQIEMAEFVRPHQNWVRPGR